MLSIASTRLVFCNCARPGCDRTSAIIGLRLRTGHIVAHERVFDSRSEAQAWALSSTPLSVARERVAMLRHEAAGIQAEYANQIQQYEREITEMTQTKKEGTKNAN